MTQLELLQKMRKEATTPEAQKLLDTQIASIFNSQFALFPERVTQGFGSLSEEDARRNHTEVMPGESGNAEVPEEYYAILKKNRVLARNSVLAGTVVHDGQIFSPYIHRTHLPFKVLELIATAKEIVCNGKPQVLQVNGQEMPEHEIAWILYTHLLVAKLQQNLSRVSYFMRSDIACPENTLLRLDGSISKKFVTYHNIKQELDYLPLLEAFEAQYDSVDRWSHFEAREYEMEVSAKDIASSRVNRLSRSLATTVRIHQYVTNLMRFLFTERKLAKRMLAAKDARDSETLDLKERWGCNAARAIEKIDDALLELIQLFIMDLKSKPTPLFNRRSTSNYYNKALRDPDTDDDYLLENIAEVKCNLDQDKVLDFIRNQGSWTELSAFDWYLRVGLYGTLYSILTFPDRYSEMIDTDKIIVAMLNRPMTEQLEAIYYAIKIDEFGMAPSGNSYEFG